MIVSGHRQLCRKLRRSLKKSLVKKKVILLIQTNASILQSGGTDAFKRVERIAHEDLKKVLQDRIPNLNSILKQRVKQYQDSIPRTEGQLKGVDKRSKRGILLSNWINTLKRWIYDMKAGYEILLPTRTFKNKLKLDLGDMNLELIYFGQASDYGGKIIIRIEEENLLFLGDIFYAYHILPYGPYYKKYPDVKRWITILQGLTTGLTEHGTVSFLSNEMFWAGTLKYPFRKKIMTMKRVNGKYLFFISSRKGNMDIYLVSAKFIEKLKPKNI